MSKINNNRSYRKLHWITAGTARRLVEPYIQDPALDVWKFDLFTLCRTLHQMFRDTLFFLVDNTEDEKLEAL